MFASYTNQKLPDGLFLGGGRDETFEGLAMTPLNPGVALDPRTIHWIATWDIRKQ